MKLLDKLNGMRRLRYGKDFVVEPLRLGNPDKFDKERNPAASATKRKGVKR